jgi:hypothetical protein
MLPGVTAERLAFGSKANYWCHQVDMRHSVVVSRCAEHERLDTDMLDPPWRHDAALGPDVAAGLETWASMRHPRGVKFAVRSSTDMVSAWSEACLPFEPRGWQLQFRQELRDALRGLASNTERGLLAEYDSPNEASVDVENVLLYNVGMAAFGPLVGAGVTCRRGRSADARHHMFTAWLMTFPTQADYGRRSVRS